MKKIKIEYGCPWIKGTFVKTVTGINKNKSKNTYTSEVFNGEYLKGKQPFVEEFSVILQVENFGTARYPDRLAYIGVVNEDGDIDWQNNGKGFNYPGQLKKITKFCEKLLEQQLKDKLTTLKSFQLN